MRKTRRKKIQQRLLQLLAPFVLIFVAIYTIYQLMSGERGLFTWLELREQVAYLKQENAAMKKQKEILNRQTERLNANTLDEDYVDEMIRRNLPFLKEGEMVLYVSETEVVR